MGKKTPEVIHKMREDFLKGAKKEGVDVKAAEKVFDQIEHFGGYGFNKSHATCYALLAYQTAFLKANFPPEYMCSLISSAIGMSSLNREQGSKVVDYIDETKKMGIEVMPPDLLSSDMQFTLTNEGKESKVRFGLLAIKNVGEGAVSEILRQRSRSVSVSLISARVDTRTVNRKSLNRSSGGRI